VPAFFGHILTQQIFFTIQSVTLNISIIIVVIESVCKQATSSIIMDVLP